tara:strand:- start:9665 stop:10297 length:633 start_codon:yes stop_codon:yes gene_type:complete
MKVIAFSLWGDNPKYTLGAIKNVEIAKELFPDWTCRFYLGEDVPEYIIQQLGKLDAECCPMSGSGWNGMFWRFFAADSHDTMISRDTDSRLGEREKVAIDEWLDSDKDFHIIRDHPYHATEILGGMWGARNGILKGIKGMIKNHNNGSFDDKYQVDQNFLRDVIYPIVKDKAIVHDEFFENKPFPKDAPQRTSSYFVGQVYDHLNKPEFT